MDLLYEPEAQKQAFIDACAWAQDIYLCFAWIEPGDPHGPSFADLAPHEKKVRQAIVGLSRFQSYPALLRRLHRFSVLRLVSTVDGSFTPNCCLFRNGARVRLLLSSAPFTSTRFSMPCECLVVFEGDRDDPFSLQGLQLLDRCRAFAHVPTSAELDAYEDAWAAVRAGGREPDVIAGLRIETYDGSSLGTLALERTPEAVLEAFVSVRSSLAAAASMKLPATILPEWAPDPDAALRTTLYWSPLGMWSALHRGGSSYHLHCGFVAPWEVTRPAAALSLVAEKVPLPLCELIAKSAPNAMAIARADDGRAFLVHLVSGLGGHTADADVGDLSGTTRAAVIGQVGSADFVQTVTAFGYRSHRRRAIQEAGTPS